MKPRGTHILCYRRQSRIFFPQPARVQRQGHASTPCCATRSHPLPAHKRQRERSERRSAAYAACPRSGWCGVHSTAQQHHPPPGWGGKKQSRARRVRAASAAYFLTARGGGGARGGVHVTCQGSKKQKETNTRTSQLVPHASTIPA